MHKIISFITNLFLIFLVIVVAVSIATIAITKKVNEESKRGAQKITATVIKKEVPIVALTDGIVEKIKVVTGQQIKKGDLMVQLGNSTLEDKIKALDKSKDNTSAQNESRVAKEELKNFVINAPLSGAVGEIYISDGAPVQKLSKILTLFSNENIKLLTYLSTDEYLAIKKQKTIQGYNERLDQSFDLFPDTLNPTASSSSELKNKKIGLFLKLRNGKDAESLINNEDLVLDLNKQKINYTRPIDIFVNFWNRYLSKQ